jgi:hypothetical protein
MATRFTHSSVLKERSSGQMQLHVRPSASPPPAPLPNDLALARLPWFPRQVSKPKQVSALTQTNVDRSRDVVTEIIPGILYLSNVKAVTMANVEKYGFKGIISVATLEEFPGLGQALAAAVKYWGRIPLQDRSSSDLRSHFDRIFEMIDVREHSLSMNRAIAEDAL